MSTIAHFLHKFIRNALKNRTIEKDGDPGLKIMAKNKCTVLLGYEDDLITEKQMRFIDFTTNKVGGKPVSSHFLC